MRQLSAFHADVSCAQPGALDCYRFGELVLDIFGEEVLVTRAKEIMGVVVIMADAVIELDIAQSFDVIRVMEHGIPNLPYLIVDRPERCDECLPELAVVYGRVLAWIFLIVLPHDVAPGRRYSPFHEVVPSNLGLTVVCAL